MSVGPSNGSSAPCVRRKSWCLRAAVLCLLLTGGQLQAQQQGSGASAAAVSGRGKTNFIPIWISA